MRIRPLSVSELVAVAALVGALLGGLAVVGFMSIDWQSSNTTIRNWSDTPVCVGTYYPEPECYEELAPQSSARFYVSSCNARSSTVDQLVIYDLNVEQTDPDDEGPVIYRRVEDCGGFDGETVIIDGRSGDFVVVDTLP